MSEFRKYIDVVKNLRKQEQKIQKQLIELIDIENRPHYLYEIEIRWADEIPTNWVGGWMLYTRWSVIAETFEQACSEIDNCNAKAYTKMRGYEVKLLAENPVEIVVGCGVVNYHHDEYIQYYMGKTVGWNGENKEWK